MSVSLLVLTLLSSATRTKTSCHFQHTGNVCLFVCFFNHTVSLFLVNKFINEKIKRYFILLLTTATQ